MITNPFVEENQSIAQVRHINQSTIVLLNTHLTQKEIEQNFTGYVKFHQGTERGQSFVAIQFQNKQTADQSLQICSTLGITAKFISDLQTAEYVLSVINLPFTTPTLVQDAFSIFGPIQYVKVVQDQDKEQKGVAYVSFQDFKSYEKAITAKTLPFEENILHLLPKQSIEQMEAKLVILQKIKQSRDRKKDRNFKVQEIKQLKFLPKMETNQEHVLKNEMRTPSRIMRKKIKKVKEQVGDDEYKLVKRINHFKQQIQHKQDEFFQLPSQLRERKDKRRKVAALNRRKANKLHNHL